MKAKFINENLKDAWELKQEEKLLLIEAIELLKRSLGFIDVIRFEEGEDVDEDNLEAAINLFLEKTKKWE